MNMNFEWRHSEEKDGNVKESYLNIPIKVVNSVDSGYGYHGNLICNECQNSVNQIYICGECGDKATIGEIKKRKDDKRELIYEEQMRAEFMKNEVDKTLRVIDEIPVNIELLQKMEHFEKTYEVYNTDEKVTPVIVKIHGYLLKKQTALVCEFGYSNRGKSNKLGGILIAGDSKLLIVQLRDYRLIRTAKQQGLPQAKPIEILDTISENPYPELYEKFLDMIENGEEIEVTVQEKPKILVECDFLD